MLTVRLWTAADCIRYFQTNEKRQREACCGDVSWTDHRGWMGWHNSVTLWCWGGHIWSASQHEIRLSLPPATNGYLGLHKTRLGSAEGESTFKNGDGSTDLEIRTPFVLHQPCNKDGKTAREGREPQQRRVLENSPCWGHGCFPPSVQRAPAAQPPLDRNIRVCWAS